MLSEWLIDLEEKAFTKNWDDFLYMAVTSFGIGTLVFFFFFFKYPILLDYILYLPAFIVGSFAMMIYLLFTKTL